MENEDIPPFECSNDCGFMGSYKDCVSHEKMCKFARNLRQQLSQEDHPNKLWSTEARIMADTLHSLLCDNGHPCNGESDDFEYDCIAGILLHTTLNTVLG